MVDKKAPRTGIIYNRSDGKAQFTFYLENYCATFMDTSFKSVDLSDTFIYGKTYNHMGIAIYKGEEPIHFSGTTRLKTSAYIVATENARGICWDKYDYIEFVGGSLNNLFYCNAFKRQNSATGNNEIVLTHQNDSLSHYFKFGDCTCTLIIGSMVSDGGGISGTKISNDKVVLQIHFDHPQPLADAFKYIWKIKEMISIMSFRKNVGFDEIYLRHNDTQLSKMQVFIREESTISEKNFLNCITFHDLGESVPKLADMIFNSQDKQPSYEIGFFPSSDKDIHQMTNEKVRLICSAIECELSFINDLCVAEEAGIHELKEQAKRLVKEFRQADTDNCLSEKAYDLIFSNIKNWSMNAGDRMCHLYHRYEAEMSALTNLLTEPVVLTDKDIFELVKYRNDVTHGAYREMSTGIAKAAFLLQALVYCCLLTRIGLSRDHILVLCQRRKIIT